ncbi:D111/G-patch domain-containing protein [Tasmannia lanceolata]|uniref:D111/G-patch domain-containing protein n=1 Tax=Tasmannia lanceolata TaxID=3420 RepID=UPI004062813A
MAESQEAGSQNTPEGDSLFQWDETSQLYFHASSGFYHDPNAGWYYSSRDGIYYTFENGVYVLLESEESKESEARKFMRTVSDEPEPVQDKQCTKEHITSVVAEIPPRPSEWLEETLIDLYLTGYPNSAINSDDLARNLETNGSPSKDTCEILPDQSCSEKLPRCYDGISFEEMEEGEWVPEDMENAPESSGRVSNEDTTWDEENWRAQYGQVIQSGDEGTPAFHIVDLWDWALIRADVSKKKRQVFRLVGRLVKQSAKLHPSMPAGGGLQKTAAIRKVHLDLVQVASGQVYRLRSPSTRYLASLSAYDSSNPTKDWGFPDLFINVDHGSPSDFDGCHMAETSDALFACEDSSATPGQLPSVVKKHKTYAYRDRAAERRILHGGFGIGPGQKNSVNDDIGGAASCSVSVHPEEAAAEAMNMSFGCGSYARRILESMGWKEGEALGNTRKGLKEPLQAAGNKGYAGLGWNHGRV